MIEHNRGRAVPESRLHDFARMNGGAADRAPEEIFEGDQTVTAVEMEHTENLMLASTQVNPEELPSQRRRGEHGGTDTVTLR